MIKKLLSMTDDELKMYVSLAFFTAFGAFGGFPKPPKLMESLLAKNDTLRWIPVYVLIYQGGGQQNWRLILEITVSVYILYQILEYIGQEKKEIVKEVEKKNEKQD